MPVIPELERLRPDMTRWRRDLHRRPETAFEERWSSDYIAERLQSFGIRIHRGLAMTGIVGVIEGATKGNRAIGLRADIDALDILEANTFEHRSLHPGKMHACGHDGHSAMLLGAAAYLADHRDFPGTVYVIFQPAEENEGGAGVMLKEGLFEQFPMDAVYGMHNRPGLPVGKMVMRTGPTMAGFDIFDIEIEGMGAHGAMPDKSVDPVIVQAHLVTALQTITSRNIDPLEAAVLSVTQVHAGDAYNVIPQQAVLRGTVRTFKAAVQDKVEAGIRRISEQMGAVFGARIDVRYERRYPALVNDAEHMEICRRAAVAVCGEDNVAVGVPPTMASEDFAFMLQAKPGCYVNIGNGEGAEGGCMVHNPRYDFNDRALAFGASYWVELTHAALAQPSD
jgi:hippurate hydrolase